MVDETIVVFGSIVAIVAIVVVGGVLKAYFNSRSALRTSRAAAQAAAEEAEHLSRLDKLEERIEVLERIVTDERYELQRRFKGL